MNNFLEQLLQKKPCRRLILLRKKTLKNIEYFVQFFLFTFIRKIKRRVRCHLEAMSLKTLNDQHNFQKKINNHGTVECLFDIWILLLSQIYG